MLDRLADKLFCKTIPSDLLIDVHACLDNGHVNKEGKKTLLVNSRDKVQKFPFSTIRLPVRGEDLVSASSARHNRI